MPAGDPFRNVEANREGSLYIFHLNFAELSRHGPQASRPAAPAWHMGMKAYLELMATRFQHITKVNV